MVAAGSVISSDVPPGALVAVERSKVIARVTVPLTMTDELRRIRDRAKALGQTPLTDQQVMPPSTTIVWPVMNPASLLNRNRTTGVMSSTFASRPRGVRPTICFLCAGPRPADRALSKYPGATEFTVM